MLNRIGIRLEDKNEWERRVPLIPRDVAGLTALGIEIWVERFARRAFADRGYEAAGARLIGDARACDIVLGIKEMPKDYFRPDGAYMFFSHTIKGQSYNMEMLATLIERKCTLLDYELVTERASGMVVEDLPIYYEANDDERHSDIETREAQTDVKARSSSEDTRTCKPRS